MGLRTNITAEYIFAYAAAGGDLYSTSEMSIVEYHAYFEAYSAAYDAAVHFNIGSGFSASYQNGSLAGSAPEDHLSEKVMKRAVSSEVQLLLFALSVIY